MRLEQKIRSRTARAGVVGLGYVGLPLAMELAESGLDTTGIDLDGRKTAAVNAGQSYIPDVADARVMALRNAGRLRATTDFSVLGDIDTVNICVPTPLRKTKDPDMSYIVSAVEQVALYLHPEMLVILESTTYPGTTEELVLPMLEAGGLKAGRDFYLAFSPERVDPGNPVYGTRNTPKVIGGITPACTELASLLYGTAVERVVPVSSAGAAEMVKLLENTFRSVNIGLVNEVALMCARLGLDVWEVIDAAATKPFGFMKFTPGPGIGGHCIPIDPLYLSWKLRTLNYQARFIELADSINSAMPEHVVERLSRALNDRAKSVRGSRILVLGVAYKRDIDDLRESPALEVIQHLRERGAIVRAADPHTGPFTVGEETFVPVAPTPREIRRADAVVITTDHSAFDIASVVRDARLVLDTRNATGRIRGPKKNVLRL
jgi:UDP-N-acetyl-D-glucosamine dehydrogenase